MTAADYARRYHSITIVEPALGLSEIVEIRNYISGWTQAGQNRKDQLLATIAQKTRQPQLPDPFFMTSDLGFDVLEPFYKSGLRRAFIGKGSPDEIRDAIRLASAVGIVAAHRPGGGTVTQYCNAVFGIDCNAFVGNYYAISPGMKPRNYALGFQVALDKAGNPDSSVPRDDFLTAPLLPLGSRTRFEDIRAGDVVITVVHSGVHPHSHIALLNSFQLLSQAPTIDKKNRMQQVALLSIAEWGSAGGAEVHITNNNEQVIEYGPLYVESGKNAIGGAHALGFGRSARSQTFGNDTAYVNNEPVVGPSFRYFFAPPGDPNSAGWGRCGDVLA